MRSRVELARHLLNNSFGMVAANLKNVTLEEALYSDGGYRSVLGVLKHIAGWTHVYHSYAFDPAPKHWRQIPWPRRMRDKIETTQDYYDEVIAWWSRSRELWMDSLEEIADKELDKKRPLHWGATAPLFDILVLVANHHAYHTGELNMLLSIAREEAWEEGEEVEENHISTIGHRVPALWMRQSPTYPLREATLDKSDDEIATWIDGHGGVEKVMGGIFEGMKRSLRPEWKEDVIVGYELTLGGKTHRYAVTVKNREVAVEKRDPSDARVTIQMSVPDYLRLITLQLDALEAASSGRLGLKGDLTFAQRLPNMYRI